MNKQFNFTFLALMAGLLAIMALNSCMSYDPHTAYVKPQNYGCAAYDCPYP